MKTARPNSGFALAITLVLMSLVLVVIVAYLANTRTDRSSSSIYANRLKAKMMAESGLTAATRLLKDNTQYGNYITAMPPPSPAPPTLYTEIYRPTDPADTTKAKANEFLQLSNAGGDILVSRASQVTSPAPQIDPRPTPAPMPSPLATAAPFLLPSPSPALITEVLPPSVSPTPIGNSYNFNQVVRTGLSSSGRLVEPSPSPSPPEALGQWVNVRDTSGNLTGRYAFFIEDESMKVNINTSGNTSPTPRPTDLDASVSTSQQVQEIDPTGVLPAGPNRATAYSSLTTFATPGARFESRGTSALIDSTWQSNYPSYASLATIFSRDDLTTARGWQRLDLNGLVASATTNTDKIALAQRIANWIRDAWTGPTAVGSLQPFQIYNDERLRLQIAANIIDYIDGGAGDAPTDLGDYPAIGTVPPAPNSTGYPVIGIEKIPYLVDFDIIYAATDTSPPVAGKAVITMSFRLNFFNMFETDLNLSDYVSKITVTGVPVVVKNSDEIFKHDTDSYDILVGGSGTKDIPNGTVPWGGDNSANGIAGVKTFLTGPVVTETVNYTAGGSITQFESGLLKIDVTGAAGSRADAARISLRDQPARWDNSTATSLAHDFLEVKNTAASINPTYKAAVEADGTINPLAVGDPRYRPPVITGRWYNLTRTDIGRFTSTNDQADMESRSYAVDWYDYKGNRPLLFQRNGPMRNIGELGNVSACEYAWRTPYFQYPGRPENTTEPDIIQDILDRRGSSAAAQSNSALLPQDYVLVDLFKTTAEISRAGSMNINTQKYVPAVSPTPSPTPIIDRGALISLFNAVPIGSGVPAGTPSPLSATATSTLGTIVSGRRISVAPLASGGPGLPGGAPPIDNNHRTPYFTIGQIASDIGALICQSANSNQTVSGRTHSKVIYSVLRGDPLSVSTFNRNYGSDMQIEEPFRKISNSITTRGNVFRILFVGQSLRDINRNGVVDQQAEIVGEYLGESIVERQGVFTSAGTPPDIRMETTGSTYRILATRTISQ